LVAFLPTKSLCHLSPEVLFQSRWWKKTEEDMANPTLPRKLEDRCGCGGGSGGGCGYIKFCIWM